MGIQADFSPSLDETVETVQAVWAREDREQAYTGYGEGCSSSATLRVSQRQAAAHIRRVNAIGLVHDVGFRG